MSIQYTKTEFENLINKFSDIIKTALWQIYVEQKPIFEVIEENKIKKEEIEFIKSFFYNFVNTK